MTNQIKNKGIKIFINNLEKTFMNKVNKGYILNWVSKNGMDQYISNSIFILGKFVRPKKQWDLTVHSDYEILIPLHFNYAIQMYNLTTKTELDNSSELNALQVKELILKKDIKNYIITDDSNKDFIAPPSAEELAMEQEVRKLEKRIELEKREELENKVLGETKTTESLRKAFDF